MSAVRDMAVFLTLEAVNGTITENFEPSLGDTRRIIITSYPGGPADETHDFTSVDYERFQVLTRDLDPAEAESLAIHVRNRLKRIANTVVNGTWYLRVRSLQPPSFLNRDAGGRTRFVASYEAQKESALAEEAGS